MAAHPYCLISFALLALGTVRHAGGATPDIRTDLYGDPLPPGAIARLGTVRLRHRHPVESVIFTRDGNSVIAADSALGGSGDDNRICVYDVGTGKLRSSFQGHPSGCETFALSPDGKVLAGIGSAGSIRLWDLSTGRFLREFGANVEGNLLQCTFSPDGKTLASVGHSGILLWDPATGKQLCRMGKLGAVWSVAFSPDGQFLATGWMNGTLGLWDVHTKKAVWELGSEKAGFHAVAFSHDGKTIAAGGADGKVLLVGAADGKEVRRWAAHRKVGHDRHSVHALAFSPDGKILASGGDDALVRLWDAGTGKGGHTLEGHDGTVYSVAFSPDGRTLASASFDHSVRLWDVSAGKERPAFVGHRNLVRCLAFSPDGKTLASGSIDGTVRLWDCLRMAQLRVLEGGHINPGSLAFSPGGSLLACGVGDGVIRLHEAGTGKVVRLLEGHRDRVHWLAFSPDGAALASFGRDDTLRVWNLATGKERLRVSTENSAAESWVAFSSGGQLLACPEGEGTLRLWDWSAGRETPRSVRLRKEARPMPGSPEEGNESAIGMGRSLRFCQADGGKEALSCVAFSGFIHRVTFSPDGRLLASCSEREPVIRLWEVATGEEIHRFQGHRDAAADVAFSPDGRLLASGSWDHTVLIWDLQGSLEADPKSNPERCWKDLADGNARAAYRTVWFLAGMPARSVPLLAQRLRPVPALTPGRLDRLLANLNSDDFQVRSKAAAALEEVGDVAEPALRKVLRAPPSPEVRRQVEALIAKMETPVAPPERLRALRALAVLEHIGSPEAKEVLARLADGAPEARLTKEAKASLARLAQRAEAKP
jgi:WD40 repeat protein